MSNLQLIEALCELVEAQAALLRQLVMSLEQMRCLSEAEYAEIEVVLKRYSDILGADEME